MVVLPDVVQPVLKLELEADEHVLAYVVTDPTVALVVVQVLQPVPMVSVSM